MDKKYFTLNYPNSNQALHAAHRDWVPDFSNPYNLILTFAKDVSENQARKKYNKLIHGLSKRIMKQAYADHEELIQQRGYLEYGNGGKYHIHTLCDVQVDWDERFIPLVHRQWMYGIAEQIKKVPANELNWVHAYNSKMRTKKSQSGYYSDSYLVVD